MLVALVAIALWAFLGIQLTLERQLDAALEATGLLMADVVGQGESLRHHSPLTTPGEELPRANRLVVTRDSLGRILDQNFPVAAGLPFDQAAFHAALAGDHAWANDSLAGDRLRSVYLPLAGGGAVLQVAASMRPLQAASDVTLLEMLATALVGTLVTTVGAGWLARSSLEPVQEITTQARAVSSAADGRRITAYADVLELQDLIATLNDMLQRLDAALVQQRRIISDVGHDLRTPITAMRGELEVALRAPRSPERYQALLRSVLEEVDHLSDTGEALITLARLETGTVPPVLVESDVDALVAAAVQGYRDRHPARQVAVVPSMTPPAPVDPKLLALAVGQLLENAERYAPAEAPVQVTVRAVAQTVQVVVEDGGPGVPDDRLATLFEPFFRGDEARSRGGAGLGLTLVQSIARAHGGTVMAARSGLGGLRVTVAFPLGRD